MVSDGGEQAVDRRTDLRILHLRLELFASVIEHGQVAIALDPFALEQPAEAIHFALCLFEFDRRARC